MTDKPANPDGLGRRIEAGRVSGTARREPIDCGHFDIRIARDGTWHYRGSPIHRKPLVTLFSSVLTRDEHGQYWLATPVERGRIDVDDAPFVAVEMAVEGEGEHQHLTFRTNLDDIVTAGPDHPIRVETDAATGEPSPYVRVRDRLDALIARAVFYDLVELAVEGPDGTALGVWSGGTFFVLGPADAEPSDRNRS